MKKEDIITDQRVLSALECHSINSDDLIDYLGKITEAYNWVSDPASEALGLAAPQIGVAARWFIMKNPSRSWVNRNLGKDVIIVINPRIHRKEGRRSTKVESCFSAPGESYRVRRHSNVKVSYLTVVPMADTLTIVRKVKNTFTGRSAQIFQHEFDHLNGQCIFHTGEKV